MDGCSEYISAAGAQSALQRNVRDRVKKEASDRRRSILYLIAAYLREQNFTASSECLEAEVQLSSDFEVCDNIDLDTILQEYQSYYYSKFNKHAKILRKCNVQTRVVHVPKETKKKSSPAAKPTQENPVPQFQFEVRKLLGKGDEVVKAYSDVTLTDNQLRPLIDFDGYSSEWREIAEIILKEVVPGTMGVAWKDCVGLGACIELLKEAVVYPLKRPELFTGLVTPWKGVLLYGPPGTGKTLLSKAVACESKTMFFNVTSSGFVHKYRGDSEKMLKVLFDVARLYAPSTIFVDELDALASCSSDFQHDASRRFKAELLIQLDGILRDEDKVFVLATTNRPWDLDSAVLRRFEKRILVDLPGKESRWKIFRYYFGGSGYKFNELELDAMSKRSADFSGSDIKNLCREACMGKLRQGLRRVENNEIKIENLEVNSPCLDDVLAALMKIRPVANARVQEKYLKWRDEFGCY
ncbi:hypothetical protein RN001_015140 [Aquatica leii]|uniref:AAA+ ATPase domain-containing protein n=1 Tax=Aquatica leii TaxID=1421715 RepID=A0AAN7P2Y5_9COLE|nr:hypothetical protein RN001_015140 [Aquatica leii]